MRNDTDKLTDVLVSVIVVTFNSTQCIERCIDSLLRTVCDKFEIIVLDNDSKDETLKILLSYRSKATIIPLGRNLGLAKARNIGSRVAQGTYLAFIDHDTVVDPMWLTKGIEELKLRPKSGLLQFKVLSFRDSRLIANAGLGDDGSWLEGRPTGMFRSARRILYAVGAGILIPISVFQKIGGFDESFFVGYDDFDFGWRARLLGFDPVCAPTATVYHDRGSIRPGRALKIFQYYGARNRLCMYIQNLSTRSLISNLPVIALWYPFEAVLYGKAEGLRALFRVLFAELRRIYRKRLEIQRDRVCPDSMLMPWGAHILPVRKFSESVIGRIRYFLRMISAK